jgi:hypothetical protein
MKIEINIPDERIVELVEHAIVKSILENRHENREAQYGVRSGIDKAVKQYIYVNKDKIIERVVERASTEIVKKGLPKLLESIGKGV